MRKNNVPSHRWGSTQSPSGTPSPYHSISIGSPAPSLALYALPAACHPVPAPCVTLHPPAHTLVSAESARRNLSQHNTRPTDQRTPAHNLRPPQSPAETVRHFS